MAETVKTQPNIIFIIADDLGARELGCSGNTFNETPNLDRLAEHGMKFTQAYSQPVCSPARAAVLTGLIPTRTGINEFLNGKNHDHLNPDTFTTWNQVLQKEGYHTGIIGKWHLNAGYRKYPSPGVPYDFDFNEVIMSEQRYIGPGYYFYPYFHLPQITGEKEGRYLVEHMNEEAVKYIETNKDKPFALYLSHYAVHTKLEAPQDTVDYFQRKRGSEAGRNVKERNPYLAAMLKFVDDGVGAIMDKLDELGIADNTVVVFFSDNGGTSENTLNGELRGSKRQLYEGGIRVPLIIRWPGVIGENTVSDEPVTGMDFFSTFLEMAGVDPGGYKNDGLSLMPVFKGASLERDALYWCYPRNANLPAEYPEMKDPPFPEGGVIRKGDFKLLESFAYDRRELYNLKDDVSEENDLAEKYPDMVRRLSLELNEKIRETVSTTEFTTDFDDGITYRWTTAGTAEQSDGAYHMAGGHAAALAETKLFYDAVYETDIRVENGRAGLIIRAGSRIPEDGARFNGYSVTYAPETKMLSLNRHTLDGIELIREKTVESGGAAGRIKVENTGSLFSVHFNGSPVFEAEDGAYFRGIAGLYAESEKAAFERLSVRGCIK